MEGENSCCICLEPFSHHDPSTVTNCNHEYHLQCVLEWLQRSRECPICLQLLGFRDPVSQALLATVEEEKSLRSRGRYSNSPRVSHVNAPSNFDVVDIDDQMMSSQLHYRRGRHRTTAMNYSQLLILDSSINESCPQQLPSITVPEDQEPLSSPSRESHSPDFTYQSMNIPPSIASTPVDRISNLMEHLNTSMRTRIHSSQTSLEGHQRSQPSDVFSFSDLLKSRLSAASSRCKESISKSTMGFKEKLLARNNTVRELSREVQREVSAGVSRLMERLDPALKKVGSFASPPSPDEGTSDFLHDGRCDKEIVSDYSSVPNNKDAPQGSSSTESLNISGTTLML